MKMKMKVKDNNKSTRRPTCTLVLHFVSSICAAQICDICTCCASLTRLRIGFQYIYIISSPRDSCSGFWIGNTSSSYSSKSFCYFRRSQGQCEKCLFSTNPCFYTPANCSSSSPCFYTTASCPSSSTSPTSSWSQPYLGARHEPYWARRGCQSQEAD